MAAPGFVMVQAVVQGTCVSVQRKDLEGEEEWQDENFFDAEYSIAASTGMLMWEGSWAAVELLRDPQSWLTQLLHGKRVVELGAGIGLLGLCSAVVGAHVLLTDVAPVVDSVLRPNIVANGSQVVDTEGLAMGTGAWEGAVRVGQGSASAQGLNWLTPLEEQSTPLDPRDADIILAAECVWLSELVQPFVHTVLGLLGGGAAVCVLAFRERSVESSTTFCSGATVISAFEDAGCHVLTHGEFDAPETRGVHGCGPVSMYEIRKPPQGEIARR